MVNVNVSWPFWGVFVNLPGNWLCLMCTTAVAARGFIFRVAESIIVKTKKLKNLQCDKYCDWDIPKIGY